MHRFSGSIVVIAANVHALGHRTPMLTHHVPCANPWLTVYKGAFEGSLQVKLRIPLFTWGLIALCAFDLLFVSSLCLRDRMYSLFFATHIICVIMALVAVSSFVVIDSGLFTNRLSDIHAQTYGPALSISRNGALRV